LPAPGGNDAPPPAVGPTAPVAPMPAAPSAPSAPSWTVTGVLQSSGEDIAILRNGDERRIVRAGDMVDGEFRIVDVTRQHVILRHGANRYTLPLGGAKTTPAVQARRAPQSTGTAFRGTPDTSTAPSAPPAPGEAEGEPQKLQDAVQNPGSGPQGVTDTTLNQLQNLIGKR